MILATPIFYPVIIKLNFDPIWFGMVIAITVMIEVVVPPVAINVFVVKSITKIPFAVGVNVGAAEAAFGDLPPC